MNEELMALYRKEGINPLNPGCLPMFLQMPVFIALISARFPAGVQLYWVVSNMLTVGQQLFILRTKEARK